MTCGNFPQLWVPVRDAAALAEALPPLCPTFPDGAGDWAGSEPTETSAENTTSVIHL